MKRSLYVFIIATLLLTGCSLKSETQGSTESSTTGSTSDSTTYSETTESVLSEETFVPDEHYDGDLFYSLVVDYVELRSLGEDEPLYSMTQIEDHDEYYHELSSNMLVMNHNGTDYCFAVYVHPTDIDPDNDWGILYVLYDIDTDTEIASAESASSDLFEDSQYILDFIDDNL